MSHTVADFRARFSEFDSVPDATVQIFLDDAELCVDEDRWGKFYDIGILYLAAHELQLDLKAKQVGSLGSLNVAGPISARTADKVSYTRAVNGLDIDGGQARLASTTYGLKYLELLAKVKPVGFMVI
jgi:hypothetical protein